MQVGPLSISSLDKSAENLRPYLRPIWNANSSAQFQKSPFTMIQYRHHGLCLQKVVRILKKSGQSLVDQIVFYHLNQTAFGRQLKLNLLWREDPS